ncbi:MAG TPA: hypothetical protein VGD61_01970 [Pyrinomonadaceae bacterium]
MNKKLGGKALAKFEAERDVSQEVLDSVREIKAGGGKRTKIAAKSPGRRNNSTGLLRNTPKAFANPSPGLEQSDNPGIIIEKSNQP